MGWGYCLKCAQRVGAARWRELTDGHCADCIRVFGLALPSNGTVTKVTVKKEKAATVPRERKVRQPKATKVTNGRRVDNGKIQDELTLSNTLATLKPSSNFMANVALQLGWDIKRVSSTYRRLKRQGVVKKTAQQAIIGLLSEQSDLTVAEISEKCQLNYDWTYELLAGELSHKVTYCKGRHGRHYYSLKP